MMGKTFRKFTSLCRELCCDAVSAGATGPQTVLLPGLVVLLQWVPAEAVFVVQPSPVTFQATVGLPMYSMPNSASKRTWPVFGTKLPQPKVKRGTAVLPKVRAAAPARG